MRCAAASTSFTPAISAIPLSSIRSTNSRPSPRSAAITTRVARIDDLPEALTFHIGDTAIHLVHDIADVPNRLDGIDLVVTGHSHKPLVERRGATLFVNPGSAGPRRFKLPVTLGIMLIDKGEVQVEIVQLIE
jgi:predicted phosphodiesterase